MNRVNRVVIAPNWDLLIEIDNMLFFQRCAIRENYNCGFDCALCSEPIEIKWGSGKKWKIALCHGKEILVDIIEDRRILSKHSELFWDENKYGCLMEYFLRNIKVILT